MATKASSVIVPRRHKFNARAGTVDGIRFDSQAEIRRYGELVILRRAGHIRDLKVHHRWELRVNGTIIGYYESDFDYVTKQGALVIEDVKGYWTVEAKLKVKLFEALYCIQVTIINARRARAA